jgi:arylamine N-acetyltransferase
MTGTIQIPAPVQAALRELSALPYENLSKIIAAAEGGASDSRTKFPNRASLEKSRMLSNDWLEKNRTTGTGGTCFSLTWWLAQRLKAHGISCEFLMGDKGKARNIHCALRIQMQGHAFLLDPGYMLFEPLPLPDAGLSAIVWVSPNEVRIEDVPALEVWRLWSGPKGKVKFRFDFRRAAVTEDQFLTFWDASFDLPMMAYPVLNRIQDGTQYYLQKRSLLIRKPEGDSVDGGMRKLGAAEMLETLGVTFGIPEGLARDAMQIVLAKTPDFFSR